MLHQQFACLISMKTKWDAQLSSAVCLLRTYHTALFAALPVSSLLYPRRTKLQMEN